MWWQSLIAVAVLIGVVYGFFVIVGYRTRLITRKTDRTAESMYDDYADSTRKQRKYARDHDAD